MTTQTEALKSAIEFAEYCLEELDLSHMASNQAKRLVQKSKEALSSPNGEAQPEQEKERCVGCEACIDTACGRDECPKGWPKALQPEQEPVADKHQAFIDSLPSDMEDKMFEQIHYWARQSYARHYRSTRGQMITAADSPDNHFIWAALRWAKENAAPQAQRTWVGLTPEQRATIAEANNMLVDDDLFDAIEAKLKEKNA